MSTYFTIAMITWMTLSGLLMTVGAADKPKAGQRPPSDPSAANFNMTAEKFFALKKVGLPIDALKVDHPLLAAALFHETNVRRGKNGQRPLRHDARLDAAARMQATHMAQENYVDHINPHDSERRTPQVRAKLAGFSFRFLAENVADHFQIKYEAGREVYQVPEGSGFSYRPGGKPIPRHTYHSFASALLDQWMNSPGHRRNILSAQPEEFGADCRLRQEKDGMDLFFCVQLFGTAQNNN